DRVRGRAVRRPGSISAAVAPDLLRDTRDHGAGARRGCGDAWFETLDRRRRLHLPAVRVREGAARAGPRGPRRRATARDSVAADAARDHRVRDLPDPARVRAAGL